jgi:hypothetical protein
MKFRMTKALRFWVDVEYERIRNHCPGHSRTELLSQILRKFEEAGDALRYLNGDGRVAWKATPRMLTRLADAEHGARDDLADWL